MAQIVIDVNGTPTLFSPALAHSLRKGDLFCYRIAGGHREGELTAPVRVVAPVEHSGRVVNVPAPTSFVGSRYTIPFGRNDTVLRAVGANSGCGGAR